MTRAIDDPATPGQPAAPRAPEVSFRRIEKGEATDRDISRMLELLTAAFGRWPGVETTASAAEHLRWKMSSPAALISGFLGEAGDQLVLSETCLGYRVLLRGRVAVRMQFVDTAVHPGWRGRGVSSASLALRNRTLSPLYDLSIIDAQGKIMIERAKPFGTRPLGNAIHPLLLPLDPRRVIERVAIDRGMPPALARALARPVAPLARGASRTRALLTRSSGRPGPFQVLDAGGFDQRIDRFFAAAATEFELIVERSREHLDWRFDRRAGNFHFRVAEDSAGGVLGYAVGNMRGERGHLVDVLALPGRLDVVEELAREMGRKLASLGCTEVLCWLPQRHPYREALHRGGWLDARTRPLITYRVCGADPAELEFLTAPETRVHFTLADTDLV